MVSPPLSKTSLRPSFTLLSIAFIFLYHKTNVTLTLNVSNNSYSIALSHTPLSLYCPLSPLAYLLPLRLKLPQQWNLTPSQTTRTISKPSLSLSIIHRPSPSKDETFFLLPPVSSLAQTIFAFPSPPLTPSASTVIAMVTIAKIVQTTPVLIVTQPHQATPLVFASWSDATSVVTGDILTSSAPTTTVEFAVTLGTSWIIVLLNVFLHPRQQPSMADPPLLLPRTFTMRGILVESGIRVYEGGNVTIFLLHPHILLLSSFSIHRTWRTTRIVATHLFLIVSSHSILLRSL